MRVKEGTVGTPQYRMDEMDKWGGPIPCGVGTCCGGNDETPPWHTQDCDLRAIRAKAVTP